MANNRFFSETVKETSIPYLPGKLALEDLSASGCLLNRAQLELIAKLAGKFEQRRYTKNEVAALIKDVTGEAVVWPYSLIFHHNQIYVIYKGEKHKRHLGKGAHGKVKLVQRLSDNEFFALKLQSDIQATEAEFKILQQVCETPQTQKIPDRKTKSGADQALVLMKLARGVGIDSVTEQEVGAATCDEDDVQIIEGSMPPALRIQLALDALISLDRLHLARNVLHRDLQPGNIMLDLLGQRARLIDYGQAIAVPQVIGLKRSVSECTLKGSSLNYSPQLRRHIPQIRRAHSDNDEKLMPEITFDRASEMYAIAISLADFFYLLNVVPDDLVDKPELWDNNVLLMDEDTAKAYLPNYRILPLSIYRKLYTLIKQMAEKDDGKRISFDDAITAMTAILGELKQQCPAISVGVIDLATVNGSLSEDAIEKIKSTGVNEIWFVDSSYRDKSTLELLTIQRQFLQAGLQVGDKCFTRAGSDVLKTKLESHLAKRPVPAQCKWVGEQLSLSAAAASAGGSKPLL